MLKTNFILYSLTACICLSTCSPQIAALDNIPTSYQTLTPKGSPFKKGQVNKTLQNIAFGSCNNQDKAQPLWQPILQNKPELWIWLGDNIYGDTEDMRVMQQKYAKQNSNPDYRKLVSSSNIIGTWDDHDLGANDAGKEYAKRDESKQLLLDFLCVPSSAEARKRAGIYQSYIYGSNPKQVKVILLDTRYFRDELIKIEKECRPNETGDILGAAQWAWLENELNKSTADINIIASSIQVLASEHRFEKWANFPSARKRLFKLLANTPAKGILLLSGDRHFAEISKIELGTRTIYDFTSSGMTHVRSESQEVNRLRVGKESVELNYGLLSIDWASKPVKVKMQARGKENKLLLEEIWSVK